MLTRDTNGQLVFPGRVRHRREFDAFDGALPSWLALGTSGSDAGASSSFTAPSTSEGLCSITTAATTSSRATLQGPQLDMGSFEALRITVEGVRFSAATVDASLGFWDDTPQYGGRINHLTGAGNAVFDSFHAPSGSNSAAMDYKWSGSQTGEYARRRNLSFVLSRLRNPPKAAWWLYILEDDDVFFQQRCATPDLTSNMGQGLVTPRLRVTTTTAAAKSCLFERLVIDAWSF